MKFKLTIAAMLALTGSHLSASVATAQSDLSSAIAADYEQNLETLFKHFHANPELSGREEKTAARLAAELRALGFDVTTGVGGTGLVAVMKNGVGETVMLRADMDGLPVKENSGLVFASKATQTEQNGEIRPVAHACGHDVHITSLIGAARQLAARKENWKGTLVLVGQPAEELLAGARAMLEDGLYTRFPKPDYALAFHVDTGVPTGQIQLSLAEVTSSADTVDITVHGVGAHGASPHKGIDPILVASQIVVSLQSIVSRSIAPFEPGVITVGSIHGGSKSNIIGDRVELKLTVRADNPATRKILLDGIDRVAKGVAISLGVPDEKLPEVKRSATETTPATINDRQTAEIVQKTFAQNFGKEIFYKQPRQSMTSEDFAYFVTPEHGVKGVYFYVGGTVTDNLATAPSHHSPLFRIEHGPAIKLGTEAMVLGALSFLGVGK